MFYGEIAAKISAIIHANPDHVERISRLIGDTHNSDESICSICAEAARVFDQIEDLSGEHFIDWHIATDKYAQEVLDSLLMGRKPFIVDMVSMAARSIEHSR
jgi:hypothetical protein